MGFLRWAALGALIMSAGSVAQLRQPVASLAPPTSAPPTSAKPAATGTAGPASLDKTSVDAWLDGYLPYAIRTADIPGAVVVVVGFGAASAGAWPRAPKSPSAATAIVVEAGRRVGDRRGEGHVAMDRTMRDVRAPRDL